MKPTPMEQAEHWHAWLVQAQSAIDQGQPLSAFVAHISPAHRAVARRAYKTVQARREGRPA